jgi:hypothetical protein
VIMCNARDGTYLILFPILLWSLPASASSMISSLKGPKHTHKNLQSRQAFKPLDSILRIRASILEDHDLKVQSQIQAEGSRYVAPSSVLFVYRERGHHHDDFCCQLYRFGFDSTVVSLHGITSCSLSRCFFLSH